MLTNTAVTKLKPKEKLYRVFDGRGLYLEVMPNGSKYWRLKYRILGKERRMALGVFPDVGLADARERRDAARKLVAAGVDPAAARKEDRRAAIINASNTFEVVAREWHEKQEEKWTPKHATNVMRRLEVDVFPFIGSRPIADIEPPDLLNDVLRRIEKREALDVAMRIKQICGQIFRYGIATGKCKREPSADLKGALKTGKTKHFAALDIKEMPEFLRALEKNDARLFARTRRAIRLLMLTFTRTTELIHASKDEFDLDNAMWEIPPERMKMGNPHLVPLSRQAIAIIKEQLEETGHMNTPFLFPGQIRLTDPMSNNTILFAIGRMGYKGRMTGHGFRALAMSNIKEKLGYRHEVVDRQLAHAHRSKVDRAYDRAQFIDERITMMQRWSDYLDVIASEGKVVAANFRRKTA